MVLPITPPGPLSFETRLGGGGGEVGFGFGRPPARGPTVPKVCKA